MTMPVSVSLVKVGNSNAIIIPAKILRQMNIGENTRFELRLGDDSMIQIRKVKPSQSPVFPKVNLPKIAKRDMQEFLDDLVVVDPNRLHEDERLSYILEQ